MSKKRRYRRDAADRLEKITQAQCDITRVVVTKFDSQVTPGHVSSSNWESSRGWGDLERTGTMVKTNINIVLISRDVSTGLVESVYLQRQKNRCNTHKHVSVCLCCFDYEFRASRHSPYLFEKWKIYYIMQ